MGCKLLGTYQSHAASKRCRVGLPLFPGAHRWTAAERLRILKLSSEDLIRAGTLLVLTGLTIMILPVPDLVVAPALVLVGIGLAPIFPSMLHLTPVYFHP